MRICFVVEWYLPGVQAGGTVRALANLVASLQGRAEVFIVTRDRDFGSTVRYSNIRSEAWNRLDATEVFYANALSWTVIRKVIADLNPDVIYVNSFFSPVTIRVLLLRALGLIPECVVIVAPHGELHPGALSIKRTKKALFIQLAMRTRLYRGVLWHATTADEKQMILSVGSSSPRAMRVTENQILIAENIVELPVLRTASGSKTAGKCRFLFIGRISRKKNLHHAISLLKTINGVVVFDIFGSQEDPAYWQECLDEISRLPANVTVTYRGFLQPDMVHEVFSGGHFFLFPTLGENYGYTVVEALSAGCPVMTSTEVPWAEMEQFHAGWRIPLSEVEAWRRTLQGCVDMDQNEYGPMVAGARAFCDTKVNAELARMKTLAMFEQAVTRP